MELNEFDFLSQETFAMAKETPSLEKSNLPESPGLLYWIEKTRGMFSVKGRASTNIQNDFSTFKNENQKNETIHDFNFFKTEQFGQAEIIYDEIFNQRFPIQEDVFCNLSDPGFSWWLESRSSGLFIHFRAQSIDRGQSQQKLGPIGDSVIAEKRFLELVSSFGLDHCECSAKGIELNLDSETLEDLRKLLLVGKVSQRFLNRFEAKSAVQLYFQELAFIRRFWLKIESHISTPVGLLS